MERQLTFVLLSFKALRAEANTLLNKSHIADRGNNTNADLDFNAHADDDDDLDDGARELISKIQEEIALESNAHSFWGSIMSKSLGREDL